MMKYLLSVLALWASLIGIANAQGGMMPGPGTPHTTYTGPCDLVSCAEAVSVTRSMKSSYTGNLFQLVRTSDSTTLNVGQVNQAADLSGILAFCLNTGNTVCNIATVYGQINGNNLTPPNSQGGFSPAACVTATGCAPPFFLDPGTGLPIARTLFPTILYNTSSATGLTGGTAAASIYNYMRNEAWSTCCGGGFGYAHSIRAPPRQGQIFCQDWATGTATPL